MSSLMLGIILILYSFYEVTTKRGSNFYADRVLWCIAWASVFILNGLLGQPYVQNVLTDGLIFTYIALFVSGHTLITSSIREVRVTSLRPVPPVLLFVVACSAVGMLAPYELVAHGGAGISGFVDSGHYGENVATINSDIRNGLVEQSLVGKVAFATPQVALILVGIFMVVGRYSILKRLALISIVYLPLFTYTFVSTIRGPIFLAVILLASSIIAGMTLLGTERSLFTKRNILVGLGTSIALFVMMLFFQSFRLKDYNFSRVGATIEHMRIWFAGYIPAFNVWLWEYWDGNLTFGASSFKFLSGLISGKGSYIDTLQSNVLIGNWTYGNASTMLRVVVNDFGVVGCGVFLFVWGMLSGLLVIHTRRGSLFFATILACNLAAIAWSPNQWFFVYGSRVLTPMIAVTYVLLMQTRWLNTPRKRTPSAAETRRPTSA